jgi:hypothetical protein
MRMARKAKSRTNLRRREVGKNLRNLVSVTTIGRANLVLVEPREMALEGNKK